MKTKVIHMRRFLSENHYIYRYTYISISTLYPIIATFFSNNNLEVKSNHEKFWSLQACDLPCLLMIVIVVTLLRESTTTQAQTTRLTAVGANQAFNQASKDFGVPAALLKALYYMEGRLSNHGGSPSIDQGYGCMHLVQNSHVHTLDQAAKDLGVSTTLLKTDLATNIRGGASVLRDYALQLSSNHTLPTSLADSPFLLERMSKDMPPPSSLI